jgi:succinoglycan biosynthesis protein ExoO
VTVDVSIIITAYNVERYIARAIQSALDQAGPSIEVILVDDCSTDGTWSIVSTISDPRLKAFRLPGNGGPSVARNAGIAQASGSWIAVLDGDDIFEQGRLARCLERARAEKADIVVDNLTVVRETGGAMFPMFPPSQFSRTATLDLAGFITGNQSFMGGYALGYLKPVFSAEFLRQHKLSYDPDIRIGEDYLIMAEALADGAVCAVEPTAGYLYTVRAGSISHRLTPDDVLRISACDKKFLARHVLNPVARKAQKRREFNIKEVYAFTLLVDAIKQKNIKGAINALSQCPTAARHLWLPLKVRIGRMVKC